MDAGADGGSGAVGSGAVLEELVRTFVTVTADAVRGAELVDLFLLLSERVVALLPVEACGILVRDGGGRLRAIGSSSASAALLDLFQIQDDDGPCLECLRTGTAVSVAATEAAVRWPRFATLLADQGHSAVHAFPLRSGPVAVGALNLFSSAELSRSQRDVAQAFADLAALVLVRGDVIADPGPFARRLEHIVQARATVAQAVGMLAERFELDPDGALRRLRAAVGTDGVTLIDVAEAVVDRSVTLPASLDLAAESD